MNESNTSQRESMRFSPKWVIVGFVCVVIFVASGLSIYSCAYGLNKNPESVTSTADDESNDLLIQGKEIKIGGIPLFSDWPKNKKPDAVVILSGQSFGFLQPCGCSSPQMGGFERRANLIRAFKAKGWPVVGVDLGDLYPDRHPIGQAGIVAPLEQTMLKYATAMKALREMDYIAVGLGKTEFNAGLQRLLSEYALQKEVPPFSLAGNIAGLVDGKAVTREAFFPAPPGAIRPLVGLAEIAQVAKVPIGIVGVVGPSVQIEAKKADHLIDFTGNAQIIKNAIQALEIHPNHPSIFVLLYQGSFDDAKKLAVDFPIFQIILCKADDPEPPSFPEVMQHADGRKTQIVQVGHKGRYVGAMGLFKTGKDEFELKYQLIPLGEELITPHDPESEKENKVLGLLEDYARQVKSRNFLSQVTRIPHPAQLQAPSLNLSYVGSEKCAVCHVEEFAKWKAAPHSQAYDALENKAKRPGLRNFDAECIVCHTVGFGFKTGFENKEKTPQLMNVGCESCHGPGSAHIAEPKNSTLLKLMSPWKQKPADKLPDAATMTKIAERKVIAVSPEQQRVSNAVSQSCMKCHDAENDPHFDLYKYWPKIVHGK